MRRKKYVKSHGLSNFKTLHCVVPFLWKTLNSIGPIIVPPLKWFLACHYLLILVQYRHNLFVQSCVKKLRVRSYSYFLKKIRTYLQWNISVGWVVQKIHSYPLRAQLLLASCAQQSFLWLCCVLKLATQGQTCTDGSAHLKCLEWQMREKVRERRKKSCS